VAAGRRREVPGNRGLRIQRKGARSVFLLCSAIPENCAFLAKFAEPSFQMTNDKFSIQTQHVGCGLPRCVFAPWRLCVEFFMRTDHPMAARRRRDFHALLLSELLRSAVPTPAKMKANEG
jgi:hypothetical protein